MSLGIVVAFSAFAISVTAATRWLAARLWPGSKGHAGWWTTIVADLIWVVAVFATALLARRYIERIGAPAPGYAILILGTTGLSFSRAYLYQRVLNQRRERPRPDPQEILRTALHNLAYLLLAAVLYLLVAWLTRRPARPVLFIPLLFGALLPDLDARDSWMGQLLPFISRWLEARLGAGQEWHSLAANTILAMIATPLIPIFGLATWGLIGLGFLAHLLVDLLSPEGVMLFWPLTRTRYGIFRGFIRSRAGPGERRLVVGLALVTVVLLLTVKIGPPLAPVTTPPTFEQSLQEYLSLRGRTLVFADVVGTWQATGRRVAERFEILSASGKSMIMLDRYTGWVFAAGQSASDNLYLNQMTVLEGAAANIKPVEVHLHDQRLGDALPTVYQMQPEPGLQHVFVSGDVILPAGSAPDPRLEPDYSQTQLRRIVLGGAGHYALHYLTASNLVGLADLRVATADLVIVATYASPPVGPTATPLPEPPSYGAGP
jgi:hypothetical protein